MTWEFAAWLVGRCAVCGRGDVPMLRNAHLECEMRALLHYADQRDLREDFHRRRIMFGERLLADRIRGTAVPATMSSTPEPDLKIVADRAFRFLCGLNLQDHTVAEQREYLDVVRAMKAVLEVDEKNEKKEAGR